MSILRRLGRRLASRMAAQVAGNELFEKPGERPRQAPLPPVSEPVAESPPSAPPPSAPPPSESPSSAPLPPVPSSGCTPMSSDALRGLLGQAAPRIVNHWATWCDPCIEELPLLEALHVRTGAVLGVSWDRFEDAASAAAVAQKVAAFSAGQGITYPSILVTDPPERFFAALDVTWERIPQTWLLDRSGAVVHRVEGVLAQETIDDLVRRLEAL